MLASLETVDRDHEAKTLARAVQIPTDYHDSHPSLGERLRLIGYWNGTDVPDAASRADTNAAEYFLGNAADELVKGFDLEWDEKVAKDWTSRHEHFQKSQERLTELSTKGSDDELTADELLEKAGIIAEKKGNAEALPLLVQAVQRFPEHAEVNYFLGGVMLATEDEAGLAHVEKAMQLDNKWRFAASDVAFQYLRSKGRLEEAKKYARVMEEEEESMQKAQAERQTVAVTDRFEAHSLEPEAVEKIKTKLKYYDEIAALYLARKVVEHRPDIPFNVLFIEMKKAKLFGGSSVSSEDLLKIAVERLEDVDIGYFVILDKGYEKLIPRLEEIDGAKIYEGMAEVS
jgi:hypothetical protein